MNKKYNKLTEEEKRVILNKGTEKPFSGKYNNIFENGIYLCKKCDAPLYRSEYKFKSTCGWPSFDDEIKDAVKRIPDPDGVRTEIVCARCSAHLGHIFKGEHLTEKNIRHCVNSISMNFISSDDIEKAYVAGGCFWGVEYFMEHKKGVISAVSGYMGGRVQNPTYKQVCRGDTKHLEAVEIIYNKNEIDYEQIIKYFFEIHDPTQKNGQGPDIGEQYLSAVFCKTDKEKKIVEKLINILKNKGLDVATKILDATKFWEAEDYHQNYYDVHKKEPYCHIYTKRF